MTWNYRILKHMDDKPWYGLHEVYYDKEYKIVNYTNDAIVVGDSVQEILRALKMMLKDASTNTVVRVKKE